MVPEAPMLVECGRMALRTADGGFMPSIPLYILADSRKLTDGLTDGQNQQAREIAQTIAGLAQIQSFTHKGEE